MRLVLNLHTERCKILNSQVTMQVQVDGLEWLLLSLAQGYAGVVEISAGGNPLSHAASIYCVKQQQER